MISFQIKPWVAFGLPYLLIELFYIGMPVVRTDGRAGGQSVYGHVITKFSRMGSLPHFFTHGALLRASRESSAINSWGYPFYIHWITLYSADSVDNPIGFPNISLLKDLSCA